MRLKERTIKATSEAYQYEVFFEQCHSTIDIKDLLTENVVKASSRWADDGKLYTDKFSVGPAKDNSNFPESEGFKTFPYTWNSSDAEGDGYFIIKFKS